MITSACAGCSDHSLVDRVRNLGVDYVSPEAVFENAAELLNSLDQSCDIEYRPWSTIVDKGTSRDKQPVLAVLTDNPDQPGTQYNWLSVPLKNVDFVQLGVRPNDRVEYYVKPLTEGADSEVERQLIASFGRRSSIDLVVGRVVDAYTLELAVPLNAEVVDPQPIVVRRVNSEKLARAELRIVERFSQRQRPPGLDPTPDEDGVAMLVSRLNLWLEQEQPTGAWSPDPFVVQHAASIHDPELAPAALSALRFSDEDGRLLQEAVWLRDVARRAVNVDPLTQARIAFEWIVRNIQLETPGTMFGIRQRPWETLLSGRGTADQRAWVFVLLARQLRMDAVLLAVPETDGPHLLPWCVAVRVGDDWFLFDPLLGMPLPGPGGRGIATLAQATTDAAVLDQLDVDDRHRYSVKLAQAKQAVALVEATPLAVSRRAALVEAQLAGERRIVLTTAPSRIAAAIRPHVADVRLWDASPATAASRSQLSDVARQWLAAQYMTYVRVPVLYKGRVTQLKGKTTRWEYNFANERVEAYTATQDPKRMFLSERVMPTPEQWQEIVAQNDQTALGAAQLARMCARYWMGLISYEAGDYDVARDYFAERVLKTTPEGLWTHGARFNLALTHEALARLAWTAPAEALDHLRRAHELLATDESPQGHGNRLRAKRLAEEIAERVKAVEASSARRLPPEPQ